MAIFFFGAIVAKDNLDCNNLEPLDSVTLGLCDVVMPYYGAVFSGGPDSDSRVGTRTGE